jgi:hypothetical protein
MTYDDAVFRQKLERMKRDGMISLTDIHQALTEMLQDLLDQIQAQKPENLEDAKLVILEEYVGDAARELRRDGWKIREYEL